MIHKDIKIENLRIFCKQYLKIHNLFYQEKQKAPTQTVGN
jgi:hypothetical protein